MLSRHSRIAALIFVVLFVCAPSVFAWAAPVVVHDWTVKSPVGKLGVMQVGYDLGFGGPLQNVHTEVYLGPIGKTTPRVAMNGAAVTALLVFLVFYLRRTKLK
jgi:hypothetical protein